jgi:hypothetical protein
MSTDITTISTSTSLVKRAGLIALFAVLALLMGAKFSGALVSGPASSGHSSSAAYYYGSSTTPGAVTNLALSSDSTGAVTVSWNNPSSTGIPITSYSVTNSDGSIVYCTTTTIGGAGSPNSCTFTPTANNPIGGVLHVTSNGGGYNIQEQGQAGVTAYVPATPTISSVTQGNGTLTVAFTVPTTGVTVGSVTTYYPTGASSSGAEALTTTAYNVYYNQSLVCTTSTATYSASLSLLAGTCKITNSAAALTNGVNYTFTMVAVNPAGQSGVATSSAVRAVATPGAPTGISAVLDLANATVDLTWTDGTSGGGTQVDTVKTYVGAGTTVTCNASALPIGSTATCAVLLSDLTLPYNGAFTVVSTNQYASPSLSSSGYSNSLVIAKLPAKPNSVTINGSSTSLGVQWSSVTDAIGYNVQLQTCTSATASTCTASGSPSYVSAAAYGATGGGSSSDYAIAITPGAIYNVAVSAVSVGGTGAPKQGTSYTSAATAPGAPKVTVTSITNGSISATIAAPTSSNGSTITSYSVYLWSVVDNSNIGSAKTLTAPGSVTFTGLAAGGTYGIKAYANYSGGQSAANSVTNATYVVAAAPSNFIETVTSTGVTFTWDAAVAPHTVSTYVVEASGTTLCTSTGTTCTITGATALAAIAAGTATVDIYSVDASGISSLSVTNGAADLAKPVTPSGLAAKTDGELSTTGTLGNVYVTWGAVSTATSYSVQAVGTDGTTLVKTVVASAAPSYTFAGIYTSTQSWTFSVASVNGIGTSAYTASGSRVTQGSAVTAVGAPHVCIVSDTKNASASPAVAGSADGCDLSNQSGAVLDTLKSDPKVQLLTSTGSAGTNGSATAAAAAALLAGAGFGKTLAPQGTKTTGGNVLTFFWTPSATDASSILTGYVGTLTLASGAKVSCSVTGKFGSLNGITMPFNFCTFIGVANDQALSFTVKAVTPFTAMNSSNSTAATIAANPAQAGPATGLVATGAADGLSAVLTWSAPTKNATNATGYVITTTDLTDGTYGTANLYCSAVAPLGSNYFGLIPPVALDATAITATCSGLTPGDKYSFSVFTTSDLQGITGWSSEATASITLNNFPEQPAAPTVKQDTSGKLTISWTAPTSDAVITSYKLTDASGQLTACTPSTYATVDSGHGFVTLASANSSSAAGTTVTCTFSGTAVGPFTVRAYSAVGPSLTSVASGSTTTTVYSTLSAPGTAYATANADGSYTVAWSATTDAAAASATGYTVTVTNGSTNLSYKTTSTNFTVPASAVSSTAVYTIAVSTNNPAGVGTPIVANQTLAPLPATPVLSQYCTTVSTAGLCRGTITLLWTKGTSGTPTNTTTLYPETYSVYATVNGVYTALATGLTMTTFTTTYSSTTTGYQVIATNANGASAAATNDGSSYTWLALGVPAAPTLNNPGSGAVGTSATGGTLQWASGTMAADVATTHNAAITAVSVSITGNDGSTVVCPALTAASTSCVLTGLLKSGVVYTYSITQSTVGGTSLPLSGTFSTTITAPGTPSVTSAVSAVGYTATGAENHSITLTWAAPASSGGAPITTYVVSVTNQGTDGATPGTTTFCTTLLTASSTTCTFNSLVASNYYSFSVQASNNGGSSAIAATTISGTNGPWTAATSLVKTKAAMAAPGAPKASGGAYTYDAAAYAALAASKTAGTGIYATINVANGGGAAGAGAALTVLLGAQAIATTDTFVTLSYPALGSVTASWTAPTATGNPVTGYVCTATATGQTTVKLTVGSTDRSCAFTGLANVSYSITVKASYVDATGTTLYGASSTPTSTSAYENIALLNFGCASVVSGTISCQWVAPAIVANTIDGLAITKYTFTTTDSAGVAHTCTATTGTGPCTITGLTNSTTYAITGYATNAAGDSTVTEVVSVKTIAASASAAPTALVATSVAGGLRITWTAPASTGSGQLVGYFVTATDPLTTQQATCPYNATYGVILAPATSCTIMGLSFGGVYTISITAITQDGAGTKQLSTPATLSATYSAPLPEPVIATFASSKKVAISVATGLSAQAKTGLSNLITVLTDGAKVTVTGYGKTATIARARANAAANYLFNNGAAVHVTIKTVISKTVNTALVTATSN